MDRIWPRRRTGHDRWSHLSPARRAHSRSSPAAAVGPWLCAGISVSGVVYAIGLAWAAAAGNLSPTAFSSAAQAAVGFATLLLAQALLAAFILPGIQARVRHSMVLRCVWGAQSHGRGRLCFPQPLVHGRLRGLGPGAVRLERVARSVVLATGSSPHSRHTSDSRRTPVNSPICRRLLPANDFKATRPKRALHSPDCRGTGVHDTTPLRQSQQRQI